MSDCGQSGARRRPTPTTRSRSSRRPASSFPSSWSGTAFEPESFVSVIFTATDDLNAQFPAVAARELGFGEVPLLCNREMDVPGAMERVIRLLAHYHAPADHTPEHVYLGETKKLRADLHSAQ